MAITLLYHQSIRLSIQYKYQDNRTNHKSNIMIILSILTIRTISAFSRTTITQHSDPTSKPSMLTDNYLSLILIHHAPVSLHNSFNLAHIQFGVSARGFHEHVGLVNVLMEGGNGWLTGDIIEKVAFPSYICELSIKKDLQTFPFFIFA